VGLVVDCLLVAAAQLVVVLDLVLVSVMMKSRKVLGCQVVVRERIAFLWIWAE
jgi:hypothetical protein